MDNNYLLQTTVFLVLCIVSTHASVSVMESVVHRNPVIKYCMPTLKLNLFRYSFRNRCAGDEGALLQLYAK